MTSLISPLIACSSAILSTPVLGSGLGGGGGGVALLDTRCVMPDFNPVAVGVVDPSSDEWMLSLESWNVSSAVKITISSPFLSSISKLACKDIRKE